MTWHSNIQGYLGSGFELYPRLIPGRHHLTARIRDFHGAEVAKAFTVLVSGEQDSIEDSDKDGLNDTDDPFPKHAFWVFDTDKDGIADEWEQMFFKGLSTAGSNTDFDLDGLSDFLEFQNGTSPRTFNVPNDMPTTPKPDLIEGWNLVSGNALNQFESLTSFIEASGADMILAYKSTDQTWTQVYLKDDPTRIVDWAMVFNDTLGYWIHIPSEETTITVTP